MGRSVNRIAIQAENIVMLSTLLMEHQKVKQDAAASIDNMIAWPEKNLTKTTKRAQRELLKTRELTLVRTQGAINALQSAIYTMYAGMGEDLRQLCKEGK